MVYFVARRSGASCSAESGRGGVTLVATASDEHDCVPLFGICISRLTMQEAVSTALAWIASKDKASCRYIVTPNVNHAVLLRERRELVEAYRSASMVLADGWPVVTTSRLAGRPLPERVTGSDFVPALFDASKAHGGLRVFLLGAAEGVAAKAAKCLEETWPHVTVCGINSPPHGFEKSAAETERIVHHVNHSRPDLVVVGLGAPKQELWLHENYTRLNASVAIAAGGTIDFLAGEQVRAPRWVQISRMEWAFRVATNPNRLALRYLRDAVHFPPLAFWEIVSKRLRR